MQFLEKTLNDLGLSNIWVTQCDHFNFNWLKACVDRRLHDQAMQEWNSHVFESNKCLNYRIFKKQFGFEKYLNNLPNKLKKNLTKFRCRNNLLPPPPLLQLKLEVSIIFQGMNEHVLCVYMIIWEMKTTIY